MKSVFSGMIIALAVSGLAGMAAADSIPFGVGDNVQMTLSLNSAHGLQNTVQVTKPESYSLWAGALDWRVTSVQKGGAGDYKPASGNLYTFCIQMSQNVTIGGSATFSVVSLNSGTPVLGGSEGKLTTYEIGLIQSLVDKHYSDLTSPANYAAMQLAIWEIVYDGGSGSGSTPFSPDFSHGVFISTSDGNTGALTTAGTWLTNLTPDTNVTSLALVSSGAQDQLIGIVAPVPLPAAAGVGVSMLVGFGGMFGLRKKLKKKLPIA
jgi:hypothetical protein